MWKDSLRAGLRNLYVNAVLAVTVIGYFLIRSMLVYTQPTEKISAALTIVFIVMLIGWSLFFCHCAGETCMEIRRKNVTYLWSLLPFLLPPVIFLLRNWILSLFPAFI